MKKYRPIKVFHIQFGYGYWFGEKVYFFGKGSTTFAIVPLSFICKDTCYASNNNLVGHGDCDSWSENRQKDAAAE
ncbi:MAG: hypothetical protein IKP36_05065 [Bacteroidaceae bacterium]|nr:hypothetical protein [Bacteroidaceae bacterium]